MSKDTHKYLVNLNRNNTNFTLQLFEFFKKTKWDSKYDFLKYYQNMVRGFINDVEIDSRGMLIVHVMGLGKSILAISIAMDLLKERQPIILLTKSLQENMRGAVHKYVNLRKKVEPDYHLGRLSEPELNDWIEHNFSFVSMNASNMLKQMGRAAEGHIAEEFDTALEKKFGEVLKMASLDGKLLIVDEAHNLFRAITNGSKNAIGLYDLIMKARNLKVVFLTGTPIANDPFELVPCFNILGSKYGVPTLPEHYKDFNKLYVDEKNGKIKNKEKFQNRILGLVSYVSHNSHPGKAFGVQSDSSTKAEFPEELPITVERVNMDAEQFVIYQLARDKEKEEGSGKFGPGNRIVESPSMTKPKSKAASTYRVKSRQLSNFCPPASVREEKDPALIPAQYLGSAKYRKMYENIENHKNQLGLVYSQFVGMGGLGTFTRYLEENGWGRLEVSAPKKDKKVAVEEFIKEPPGEQGELDEFIDEPNMVGEITGDGSVLRSLHGPALMPAEMYLRSIDNELKKVDTNTWWLQNDSSDNWYGGADTDVPIHILNGYTHGIGHYAYGSDEDETESELSLLDEVLESDFGSTIKNEYTFKYAVDRDIEIVKSLNPKYDHDDSNIKYPYYILLIMENDKPIGYARIKYSIKDDDKSHLCIGELLELFTVEPNESITTETMKKIIDDAVKCRDNLGEFRKSIWGGVADTRGVSPAARPDRKRYFAIISGDVDVEDRTRIQDMFNDENNKHGGVIDLILVSSTGAEGLDLKNVRHIHIMEPYWNWGRVKQIIARGVRNDSHKALPVEEKNVQPYIYLAIPPDTERLPNGDYPATTDTELYDESIINQVEIESFNEALREVSIECLANDESYCRVCNPSNQPLFTEDAARDVRATDPCTGFQSEQVKVEEITVDGVKYYYSADSSSIYDYKIFIYDEDIDGYRPLKESDPKFVKIVDAIEDAKKKE